MLNELPCKRGEFGSISFKIGVENCPKKSHAPFKSSFLFLTKYRAVIPGSFTNLGSGFNALTSPIYLLLSGKKKRSLNPGEDLIAPQHAQFLQHFSSGKMRDEKKKSD